MHIDLQWTISNQTLWWRWWRWWRWLALRWATYKTCWK